MQFPILQAFLFPALSFEKRKEDKNPRHFIDCGGLTLTSFEGPRRTALEYRSGQFSEGRRRLNTFLNTSLQCNYEYDLVYLICSYRYIQLHKFSLVTSPFLMLMSELLKNWFPHVLTQPNTQANGTRVSLKLFNKWRHRHQLVDLEPG